MDLRLLRNACLGLACTMMLGVSAVSVVHAAPDVMGLSVVSAGHGKVRLTVTAGPSGAPAGFEVCWMPTASFTTWPWPWAANEGWDDFTGIGTLNTWGAPQVDFRLGPNQSIDIEIGDTQDESGVASFYDTASPELMEGMDYVFCAYALGATHATSGPLSVTLAKKTTAQGQNCTFTQGYWKNHSSVWPVTNLTLGTVNYNQAQLLSILGQPVGGNGLISLAHQLIATKLNVANGADPTAVASTIAAADAQIGALVVPPVGSGFLSPASTSTKTQTLDDYNSGLTGPGHCGDTPVKAGSTWGHIKALYR